MSAALERRLAGDTPLVAVGVPAANVDAVATFAASAGEKNSVVSFSMSVSGATPTVARATLVYTKDGTTKTLGFRIPAAQIAPIVVNLASHPIEGDVNTSIVLTLPAMGASQTGEVWMVGYRSSE